jgi:hypothetical protein
MSVEYLLTDHLGSTSLTTDSSGASVSENFCKFRITAYPHPNHFPSEGRSLFLKQKTVRLTDSGQ